MQRQLHYPINIKITSDIACKLKIIHTGSKREVFKLTGYFRELKISQAIIPGIAMRAGTGKIAKRNIFCLGYRVAKNLISKTIQMEFY